MKNDILTLIDEGKLLCFSYNDSMDVSRITILSYVANATGNIGNVRST